MVFVEFKKIIY